MSLIDKNKTYRTFDKRKVRIYATDGYDGRVHGAIFFDDIQHGTGWRPCEWTREGSYNSNNLAHDYDLIEVRPRIKREVWVNVYPEPQQAISWMFRNRGGADSAAASCEADRIACVKIEIDCEEGEGL